MYSAHVSHILLWGLLTATSPYFHIRVVDEQTGRGVPLVELSTVNHIRYVTDSAGNVAFHEPGLMNQRVFFHVRSHGYEFPADGFGFRGVALQVRPGGRATLRVRRRNIAERLYRVTGAGIYRDSVLLGLPTPDVPPLLNAKVFGQDSVVCAPYRGRVYWFWGDTNRPGHPLGNFHVSGAVSELPGQGGLSPAEGVRLRYFTDDSGFVRPMARMPGEGPTWINGLVVVPDENGCLRLVAHYVKVKPPLTVYHHGLCVFDDRAGVFRHLCDFPPNETAYPGGHPLMRTDADGVRRVYFAKPYPLLRVPATLAALQDLRQYERFSCQLPGSDGAAAERAPEDGSLRIDVEKDAVWYRWRRSVPPHQPRMQTRWRRRGRLAAGQELLALRDVDSGRPVAAHAGSVYFNHFRRRYVMIATEVGGRSSFLGDVWFAEADTPVGPWVYAVRIVTHEGYSFYNPKHHPFFDEDRGRTIYFEGTYTRAFSKSPTATPRYDYNQIMYRLDLTDRRVVLPVPVYGAAAFGDPAGSVRQVRDERETAESWRGEDIGGPQQGEASGWDVFPPPLFFAFDRPRPGCVAVIRDAGGRLTTRTVVAVRRGQRGESDGAEDLATGRRLGSTDANTRQPLFFALPPDLPEPPETSVVLWEVQSSDGQWLYGTDRHRLAQQGSAPPKPVCRVFANPLTNVRVGRTIPRTR